MIAASSQLKSLMTQRADFKANATITLEDNSTITLTPSDFTVTGNTFNDGAGANGFPIGCAVGKSIQITLMNDSGDFTDVDFYGAKIRLWATYQISADNTESIQFGTFTVISPASYGSTIVITAVDDMYKADVPVPSTLVYPATLSTLFRGICDYCNIAYSSAVFTNSNFNVPAAPDTDMTCRQMLGYIAMIAGGNARISRAGYCEIKTWDFDFHETNFIPLGADFLLTSNDRVFQVVGDTATATDVWYLDTWINLRNETGAVTITGLQTQKRIVTTDEEGNETESEQTIIEGEAGYVLVLSNPLIVGNEDAALGLIGAVLIGSTFRIFDGEYLANPLVEFMDKCLVQNRAGDRFNSVITDVGFTFFGVSSIKNSAEPPLRNISKYQSAAAQAYQDAKRLLDIERTAREQAQAQFAQMLANASGFYSTDVTQPDQSTIRYLHNKPTLAESTNVIKITADAIGFSTNGGATYPFGLTIDGTAIMSIIAAEGINADWIDTGAFTIKNAQNQIIFQADASNKTIIINTPEFSVDANGNATFSGNLDAAGGTFSGTIEGADLVLGGRNNTAGKITVKNASGDTIATINNGGVSASAGTFSGTLSAATGSFSGTVTADNGSIGGWTINKGNLSTTVNGVTTTLNSANGIITVGDMELRSSSGYNGNTSSINAGSSSFNLISSDQIVLNTPDLYFNNTDIHLDSDTNLNVASSFSLTTTARSRLLAALGLSALPNIPTVATGSVSVSISGGYGTADVTFPSGRFSSAPSVTVSVKDGSNGRFIPKVASLTSAGFTAVLIDVAGSNDGKTILWQAIEE